MNTSNKTSVLSRLLAAFDQPLYRRCIELKSILHEYSPKDLHSSVPLILESIFGFGGVTAATSWCLSVYLNPTEFDELHHLLSPQGPLLQLIYKLATDPTCKYEFPVSCLPYATQCLLDDGNIPVFYQDKLQFTGNSAKPASVLLVGAFELYMFHFVYYLVNSRTFNAKLNTGRQSAGAKCWSNVSESLYLALLEDYLSYLLPLDVTASSIFTSTAPISYNSPQSCQPPTNRSFGLLKSVDTMSGMREPPERNKQMETWKAEIFLQVLVEFYLSQSSSGSCSPLPSLYTSQPNDDHMRAVRILVKHLHYFVNSLPQNSSLHRLDTNPWDDLKRRVWPFFVQKKLYQFLRHHFNYWPLDSMFRLVLETWLSYIQPWRYCVVHDVCESSTARQTTDDLDPGVVNNKWRAFIVDNLLFYTVLCRYFMLRCLRMDLSSSSNAFMLLRVCKVFGLEGLVDMIHEVESVVVESLTASDYSVQYVRQSPNSSGCSQFGSSNVAAIVKSQIVELEGPQFQYPALFNMATQRLVTELLDVMSEAVYQTSSNSNSAAYDANESWSSWLLGTSIDYNTSRYVSYDGSVDAPVMSRAAETYLDQATATLCRIFQVDRPSSSVAAAASSSQHSVDADMECVDGVTTLTALGRYQVMNGLRKTRIEPRGDPDLQPIRSFEVVFLVRLLYAVSCYINYKFSSHIESFNNRRDLIGRLVRPLLTNHNGRVRVSLRWLASYQTVGYLLALYLMLYVWLGTTNIAVVYVLLLATLLLSYCFIHAAFSH